ncbi:MAG: AAA family ATPase [Candidatus Promineifilaceae bacterium]
MSILEIRLFGGFTTWQEGKVVEPFRTQKARALVAYLLLQPGRAHSRASLAELLWPDAPQKRAAHNFRQALTFLRPTLNREGFPPLLSVTRQSVSLSSSRFLQVDVLEIERLLAQDTIPALAQAVSLYHGPLLEGFYLDGSPEFEIWMSAEREKWQSRVLAALDQLAEHWLDQGDYTAAQGYLQQAISIDPWHEQAYRELMGLLALQGDTAGALAQYERCCQILMEGLGVEPLAETQVLADQIQAGLIALSAAAVSDNFEGGMTLKFAGRGPEHARLVRILTERHPHHPHLALLEGNLGIGKSRLMAEFSRYAAIHGALCLSGRCLSYQVPVPYQPLVMALRQGLPALREPVPEVWLAELARLLPEITAENSPLPLPAATGDAAERQRLFSAVGHFIERVGMPEQPLVIFLDDLHWADNASLDLLKFLLFQGPSRLLVVGAYRPEDAPANHPLTQLRRTLGRDRRVERILLQPLEAKDIESMVEALVRERDRAALAKYLSLESQGNPFFMTELLYNLQEIVTPGSDLWTLPTGWQNAVQPLTSSMQDVVLERVERLSADSLALFQDAAVIGQTFVEEALAAISGKAVSPYLADWQQRHLIRPNERGFEFAHDKIRQVVYETIPLSHRQSRHLAVAQYLANQEEQAALTAQLAHHYFHSAEPILALPYFLRAAEEAMRVLAFEEAASLCTQALALSPIKLEERYQLLQLRHSAYQYIGDTEREGQDAAEMVKIAQNSGNPRQLADAVQRLGRYYYLRGEVEEARQTFAEVVGFARANGDLGTAARILDTLAMLFRGSRKGHQEALRLQDEALAMVREAGVRPFEAMLLADKSVILAEIGDLGTALETIERAVSLLRAEDVKRYLPHVLYIRGSIFRLIGQYELARADFDEALALCTALNIGTYLMVIYSNKGRLGLASADLEMARHAYGEMMRLAAIDARPLMRGKAHLGLGWAAYQSGDFQAAFDHLSQAADLCKQEDIQNQVLAQSLLGLALVGLGDKEQALHIIEAGVKLVEAGEIVLIEKPQLFWSYYWIFQENGRPAEAKQWLQKGRQWVTTQMETLPEQWRKDFLRSLNGRIGQNSLD